MKATMITLVIARGCVDDRRAMAIERKGISIYKLWAIRGLCDRCKIISNGMDEDGASLELIEFNLIAPRRDAQIAI